MARRAANTATNVTLDRFPGYYDPVLTLAYFGVFLVVPLTAALLLLLGTVLCVASIAVMLGLGGTGALWKLLVLPLAVLGASVPRLWRRVYGRFAPLHMVRFEKARHPELASLVGAKAQGVAKIAAAGFEVAPGFVITGRGLSSRQTKRFQRNLDRELGYLKSREVIVRSSFASEDGVQQSAAGVFHSVAHVVPTVSAVLAAIERVLKSASSPLGLQYGGGKSGLSILVQSQVETVESGFVATVDPRNGFEERALIQRRTNDESGEYELEVIDRIVDPLHPLVAACDRLQGLWGQPVECEYGRDKGGRTVFFQCRPLLALPHVATFVNGGPVAVPTVPLTPASKKAFLGEHGLAFKLRKSLEAMGLPGPAEQDVIEHLDRLYVRWQPRVEVVGQFRWLCAVLGIGASSSDPMEAGAQAIVIANAWLDAAQQIHPVDSQLRAVVEAGVQPHGRPGTPEELADPGYDDEWPEWEPGPMGELALPAMLPLKRQVFAFCLKRYRAWLIRRFECRERVLEEQKKKRARLNQQYGTPEEMDHYRASLEISAPHVLHPGAIETDELAIYGPAVSGVATGSLAIGEPLSAGNVILVVPDSRSLHAQHFDRICGLIVERGGPLSHLIMLARERGIPTILGPRPTVSAGTEVTIDGDRGEFTCIGS